MDSLRKDLDAMPTEDLVARQAALATQARRRQTQRDCELTKVVSMLMVFGGFLGSLATAYGVVFAGWPVMTTNLCAGVVAAGGGLAISLTALEVWRGDETP